MQFCEITWQGGKLVLSHVEGQSKHGPERQMLATARALYQGPELLLVDELSLGLAAVVVKSLIKAMRSGLRGSRSRVPPRAAPC
jgi:ABC-type branched-subunit amino acid transport system ATPase component